MEKEELEELKRELEKVADIKGAIWDVEDELKANQRNISDELMEKLEDAVDTIRKAKSILDKIDKLIDDQEEE